MPEDPASFPTSPASGPGPAAHFSASGLDLEAVRGLFEKLAKSSLGARAVRELLPRGDADAVRALARAAEMVALLRAGEQPSFAGISDLRPAYDALQRFHRPLEKSELAGLHLFLSASARLVEWFRDRQAGNL